MSWEETSVYPLWTDTSESYQAIKLLTTFNNRVYAITHSHYTHTLPVALRDVTFWVRGEGDSTRLIHLSSLDHYDAIEHIKTHLAELLMEDVL